VPSRVTDYRDFADLVHGAMQFSSAFSRPARWTGQCVDRAGDESVDGRLGAPVINLGGQDQDWSRCVSL
jgi:hypothetical protein